MSAKSTEKSDRVAYVGETDCPHCEKHIVIKKRVKLLTPARKAEKEEKLFAEKGTQMTLDQGADDKKQE